MSAPAVAGSSRLVRAPGTWKPKMSSEEDKNEKRNWQNNRNCGAVASYDGANGPRTELRTLVATDESQHYETERRNPMPADRQLSVQRHTPSPLEGRLESYLRQHSTGPRQHRPSRPRQLRPLGHPTRQHGRLLARTA